MARTIDQIYQIIIAEKNARPELASLTSTSKTAIYNLWAYVVAVVVWSLENLFDLHKIEVEQIISTQKPHRIWWYRDMALQFRYGQDLIPDSDRYDDAGLSAEQIEERKIIKQAAVTETLSDGRLRIKLATEVGGVRTKLDAEQLASFNSYLAKFKDAGVRVKGESQDPDLLKLEIDIWYNPMVLKSDGSRIDGADRRPVRTAIDSYLKALPFNGEYASSLLVNALQKVDGIVYPVIKNAQAKYGLFPFTVIDEKYIPDAGWLSLLDENLTINYREYVQS